MALKHPERRSQHSFGSKAVITEGGVCEVCLFGSSGTLKQCFFFLFPPNRFEPAYFRKIKITQKEYVHELARCWSNGLIFLALIRSENTSNGVPSSLRISSGFARRGQLRSELSLFWLFRRSAESPASPPQVPRSPRLTPPPPHRPEGPSKIHPHPPVPYLFIQKVCSRYFSSRCS